MLGKIKQKILDRITLTREIYKETYENAIERKNKK
jgi:hypothetical protein